MVEITITENEIDLATTENKVELQVTDADVNLTFDGDEVIVNPVETTVILTTTQTTIELKPTIQTVEIGFFNPEGVTIHSQLGNLLNDDHPQYSLVTGLRGFTGVVSGIDPTLSTHLATKNYVDTTTNPLIVTTVIVATAGQTNFSIAAAALAIQGFFINGLNYLNDVVIDPPASGTVVYSGPYTIEVGDQITIEHTE